MKWFLILAWNSLWARRFAALLTVTCIALGSAVLIVVEQLRTDAREAFTRSVSGVDLIVGPRGGKVELLMGIVFRAGVSGTGVAYDTYREIAALPGVAWALPVSFGDSHHGFPVMGTDASYFRQFRYGQSRSLAFRTGNPFTDVFDAVLGAEVADRLGYKVGDQLELEHGMQAAFAGGTDHHHDKVFRVSGVLLRTGTAVDRTVHVSLEGVEAMHMDWKEGRPPMVGERVDAETARLLAVPPDRVSAVLLRLEQRSAALSLQRRITTRSGEPLSAVLPGPALLELWEIVGVAENVLRGMSWGVVAVVLVGLLTVLWSGLEERRREMAVLRAVGARPRHVFLLILGEAFLLTLGGVALGALIAAVSVQGLASTIVQRYGLSLSHVLVTPGMARLLVLLVGAGVVAGLLPALRCYRRSLADGLSPDLSG
jgi:putative ABC transport system permease protein